MNKKSIISLAIVILLAVAVVVVYPILFTEDHEHAEEVSNSPSTTAQGQAGREIDYYTCGMHPSVKSPDPGKCPICGMNLVPVYKQGSASQEKVDMTFTVSPAMRQRIGVKYATAEVTSLHRTIHAVGKIDYNETALSEINLKISGWIEKLYVDYTGKRVRKGEPLFSLYSPELISAQEEYLLAHANYQTTGTTSAHSSPVSNHQLYERARQRLLLWGLTEEQLIQIEERGKAETYVDFASPQTGIVIEKMAVEGSNVGMGRPLYKIANLSTVWINADIYEYELSSVKVGQEAEVRVSAYPGETFRGRITYVFPFLEAMTRSVKVRMEFPNKDGKLKPEMYADVEIRQTRDNVLTIPEQAVLFTGQRQIVFVDKGDGLFEVRFVTIGERGNNLVEIKEGLRSGERVVSSANFLIDAESRMQGVLQRLEGVTQTAPAEHKH
ncbi:MAG: efflux RND transporter periplasmic adaptor subunit [Ignavibacteriae bacterium]|nr:efflux RND transporter periplasmic adaptor subunit [Ignavibacteriota bacterium]